MFLVDTHKKILFIFPVLFILFVLFTTDMRIRYMAPAIPPLVVLSMFGLARLIEAISFLPRKAFGIIAAVLIFGIFCSNANYIWAQYDYVDPGPYLTAKIDRDNYINRYRGEYAVVQYANRNLAVDAKVLCLITGNRTYYVDRDVWLYRSLFFSPPGNGKFSADTLLERLNAHPTSHIILGRNTLSQWARSTLKPHEIEVINRFFYDNTRLLYQKNGYQLLEVKSAESDMVAAKKNLNGFEKE